MIKDYISFETSSFYKPKNLLLNNIMLFDLLKVKSNENIYLLNGKLIIRV